MVSIFPLILQLVMLIIGVHTAVVDVNVKMAQGAIPLQERVTALLASRAGDVRLFVMQARTEMTANKSVNVKMERLAIM